MAAQVFILTMKKSRDNSWINYIIKTKRTTCTNDYFAQEQLAIVKLLVGRFSCINTNRSLAAWEFTVNNESITMYCQGCQIF